MAFNPNIEYNENISVKENLKAMMNWLNFACKEITVGRVPQNKKDSDRKIEETNADLEAQLLATDEVAVALFEQQLAQEEINIAQDEAVVALYEMMEVQDND